MGVIKKFPQRNEVKQPERTDVHKPRLILMSVELPVNLITPSVTVYAFTRNQSRPSGPCRPTLTSVPEDECPFRFRRWKGGFSLFRVESRMTSKGGLGVNMSPSFVELKVKERLFCFVVLFFVLLSFKRISAT